MVLHLFELHRTVSQIICFLLEDSQSQSELWGSKRATRSIFWNLLQMCAWIPDLISPNFFFPVVNGIEGRWKAWNRTLTGSGVWRPSVIVSVTMKTSIWVGDCVKNSRGSEWLEQFWTMRMNPPPFHQFQVDPVWLLTRRSHDDLGGNEKHWVILILFLFRHSAIFAENSGCKKEYIFFPSVRAKKRDYLRTKEGICVNWLQPNQLVSFHGLNEIKGVENIRRLIKKHRAVYIQSFGTTKYWDCRVLNSRGYTNVKT